MIINVTVRDFKFKIPCGDGVQTLKWLGLAASQRYSNFLVPKGRPRAREQPSTSNSRTGTYLPSGIVSKESGNLGDPYQKLCDILKDGDEVEVFIQTEVAVDEVGAPLVSPWFDAAFCIGVASKRRARGIVMRAKRTEQAFREAALRTPGDANGDDSKVQFGFQTSVHVLSHSLDSEWEASQALNMDWDRSLGKAVESLESNKERVEQIRLVLLQAFPSLHNAFVNCSGIFESGTHSGMGVDDIAHLLHGARLFHAINDASSLQKIFQDVSESLDPVDRAGMIEVLIRAALHKKDAPGPFPGYLKETLETLTQYIQTHSRDAIREVLYSQEFRHYLEQARPQLMDVFNLFADHNSATYGRGLISMDAFSTLATAAFSRQKSPRQMASLDQVIAEAFSSSQPNNVELPYLVFSEVVEAIARISVECMPGDKSDKQKIQHGLEAVSQLNIS